MDTTPRVLVGYDQSEHAERAVHWAAAAARTRDWPLEIISSLPRPLTLNVPTGVLAPIPDIDIDEAPFRAGLDRVEAAVRAEHPELEIRTRVVPPTPIDHLVAASADPGLVVVGSRGLGAVSSFILGSVSDELAAYARGPVVVVPEEAGDPHGPVVVGYADLEHSGPALDAAAVQAALSGVPLHVVTAWNVGYAPGTAVGIVDAPPIHLETIQAQLVEEAEQVGAILRARHHGLEVTVEVLRDAPVELLLHRSQTASMVVVGSRGRGGFAGLMLGSTSRRVLLRASCPAMIVPGTHAVADDDERTPGADGDAGAGGEAS